jgi:hypothetical protein
MTRIIGGDTPSVPPGAPGRGALIQDWDEKVTIQCCAALSHLQHQVGIPNCAASHLVKIPNCGGV